MIWSELNPLLNIGIKISSINYEQALICLHNNSFAVIPIPINCRRLPKTEVASGPLLGESSPCPVQINFKEKIDSLACNWVFQGEFKLL